jgi:hypothetical protein
MGAGTFHPATALRALGPEPVEGRLRPALPPPDRRPLRRESEPAQHYYQYQVILKPSPPDLQALYLGSLEAIGIDPLKHDIRFVEDDWESPTLGAWGLGWEVWCDGMEVTQFTYFQQVGGFDCKPVAGELTYGLERLAMYIQGVDSVYDLAFNDAGVSYGDVFLENEREFSAYNFEVADTESLFDLLQGGGRRMPPLHRRRPAAPRLRPGDQGEPHLQHAAGPRRDLGRRAPGLYRPGARPGERRLRGLDGEERVGGVRGNKKKTLIPTFSREREKGCAGASFSNPLPQAGEGRVRVFLLHG